MARSEHIIQASGLNLRIDQTTLLESASLNLRSGQKLAIVGPNGAGKTTLIRCLLGLIRPDSGSIMLDGSPHTTMGRAQLARRMSYVPQQLPQRIAHTASEFIAMSRYAYGTDGNHSNDDPLHSAQQAMELTGVEHLKNQPLCTMSGGERQRVSIAAAIAQQSPVMILDEPSAHLDPKQRDIIHKLLMEICRENNTALIVITHDLNWASSDFERIIGMKNGRTLVDTTADAFICEETLATVFDAHWLTHPHPASGRPMILPHTSSKP